MRKLSNERTCWPIKHRSSSELWDLSAEILTELSRRDRVSYRVKGVPSGEAKPPKGISLGNEV